MPFQKVLNITPRYSANRPVGMWRGETRMTAEHETKQRIMQAAFELFCVRGYDRVSLSEIADRAGVSKGGLFHHFDSKYDLAKATLIWWADSNMKTVLEEVNRGGVSPERALGSFVDMTLDMISEERGFIRFFWGVIDEAVKKEDHGAWMDFLNSYMDLIALQYQRLGMEEPRERALIFMAGLDGLTLYSEILKASGNVPDRKALRRALMQTYAGISGDDDE
ncbi:hypothetical protein B6U90_07410 [Thermoplasmatales archaeon ex4484_6]|nr:MAG: hypothetical protein B6U90_07410 [Thermoplasmatales archaeon ex4484_6]